MTGASEILRNHLPDRYQDLDVLMERQLADSAPTARTGIPDFLWKTIGDVATDALHDALDINLFGLFAQAWSKALKVRRYAKESLEKPGVGITLCLGRHDATTTLDQIVDITVLDVLSKQVPFELALSAQFDSAELTLLDGAIVQIRSGVCRVTAQMKLAGEPLHAAKTSPNLKLGRPYVLDTPLQVIELPRPSV